jgi:hypothetical protein
VWGRVGGGGGAAGIAPCDPSGDIIAGPSPPLCLSLCVCTRHSALSLLHQLDDIFVVQVVLEAHPLWTVLRAGAPHRGVLELHNTHARTHAAAAKQSKAKQPKQRIAVSGPADSPQLPSIACVRSLGVRSTGQEQRRCTRSLSAMPVVGGGAGGGRGTPL